MQTTNNTAIDLFYKKSDQDLRGSVQIYLTNLYKTVACNIEKQNISNQTKSSFKQTASDIKVKREEKNQTLTTKKQQQIHIKPVPIQKKEKFQRLQNHSAVQKTNSKSKKTQFPQTQNFLSASKCSTKSYKVHDGNSIPQPKDNFNFYLKKFYEHYCKKYLNTIKGQQFQKLQEFYNSMNLNKFMMYCKDLKIIKHEKSLTAKYLQQMFKSEQNRKSCLQYESFAKIIKQCLSVAYDKESIETKGYEFIGVLNRQNFAEAMGKLGVNVPLKKIIFVKDEDARVFSRLRKSQTKGNPQNMKKMRLNGGSAQGDVNVPNCDSIKLHQEIFLNEKQRKQQRLLQCLTIPNLNKLQPSKQMDEKLHEMVDDECDPYLKRYNQKNNNSTYQSVNNHGVIKRIDQRIQSIVKKIR